MATRLSNANDNRRQRTLASSEHIHDTGDADRRNSTDGAAGVAAATPIATCKRVSPDTTVGGAADSGRPCAISLASRSGWPLLSERHGGWILVGYLAVASDCHAPRR